VKRHAARCSPVRRNTGHAGRAGLRPYDVACLQGRIPELRPAAAGRTGRGECNAAGTNPRWESATANAIGGGRAVAAGLPSWPNRPRIDLSSESGRSRTQLQGGPRGVCAKLGLSPYYRQAARSICLAQIPSAVRVDLWPVVCLWVSWMVRQLEGRARLQPGPYPHSSGRALISQVPGVPGLLGLTGSVGDGQFAAT